MSDFFDGPPSNAHLDLHAFFDSSVTDAILELLYLGVLVSFGLTRDRGAIGLAVFNNGRRRREYFRTPEDASDWLRLAAKALSGASNGQPAPRASDSQNPTRGAYTPF